MSSRHTYTTTLARELEDGSEIEIDIEFSYYPGTEDYFDRAWGNWLPWTVDRCVPMTAKEGAVRNGARVTSFGSRDSRLS